MFSWTKLQNSNFDCEHKLSRLIQIGLLKALRYIINHEVIVCFKQKGITLLCSAASSCSEKARHWPFSYLSVTTVIVPPLAKLTTHIFWESISEISPTCVSLSGDILAKGGGFFETLIWKLLWSRQTYTGWQLHAWLHLCAWCVNMQTHFINRAVLQAQEHDKHQQEPVFMCLYVFSSAIKRGRNVLSVFNEVHQNSEASRNESLHTRGEEKSDGGPWRGWTRAPRGQICCFP